jgi:hypothetical protein
VASGAAVRGSRVQSQARRSGRVFRCMRWGKGDSTLAGGVGYL